MFAPLSIRLFRDVGGVGWGDEFQYGTPRATSSFTRFVLCSMWIKWECFWHNWNACVCVYVRCYTCCSCKVQSACVQTIAWYVYDAAINQRDSEWHKHTICTFGATILKIRSSSPPPTTPKLSAYFAVRQNQSDTSEKSLLKCGFWRLRHLNARTRSSER